MLIDVISPKTRNKIKTKNQGNDLRLYRDRPVDFAREILGIKYLTEDAIAILESVRSNKITNVQASHGVGKSFLAGSVLVLWWIFAVKGLCITTAPTERQVKQILWSETRRNYGLNKHKLGGKIGELSLKLDENARAFGFTARSNNTNGFQGIHADYLLLIEDEACGISPEIDQGAESCIVGINNRLLRIGNPIADGTPFADSCKRSHIRIPAWNHTNVKWAYQQESDGIHRIKPELRKDLFDERGQILDREHWGKNAIAAMESYLKTANAIEIKGAISVDWIERARDKYGEGSGFWESRIEARFPLDSGQSIFPRRYFLMARNKFDAIKDWDIKLRGIAPRYGLDVGDGGDPHALARWQGTVLMAVRSQPTIGDELDTSRAAGMVAGDIAKHGNGSIGVDNIGVGAGTLAMLKNQGLIASGIFWGDSATDNQRFANLKAEQFWLLREAGEKGEIAIAPLGDSEDEAMEDLANIYYEELPTGKIKIEDKKKTRARLGRSPNCGDAIVYGYHASSAINPLLLS